MVDIEQTARINELVEQLGWVQKWAAGVQTELEALLAGKQAPPTMTVDEQVEEADSPTRVQKALEREFKVDRRTIYSYVERVVHAYQLERTVPDWRVNLGFWKKMAARNAQGTTRLRAALDALDSKSEKVAA